MRIRFRIRTKNVTDPQHLGDEQSNLNCQTRTKLVWKCNSLDISLVFKRRYRQIKSISNPFILNKICRVLKHIQVLKTSKVVRMLSYQGLTCADKQHAARRSRRYGAHVQVLRPAVQHLQDPLGQPAGHARPPPARPQHGQRRPRLLLIQQPGHALQRRFGADGRRSASLDTAPRPLYVLERQKRGLRSL